MSDSLKQLVEEAKKGNAKAQFMLGHHIEEASHINPISSIYYEDLDYLHKIIAELKKSATYWFEKVARQDNISAQIKLEFLKFLWWLFLLRTFLIF